MAIEITDLSALDPTLVTQSLAQTTEMIQEENSTIDLKRGVFHDLLLYLHALCDTQIQTGVINRYLSANSLLQIQTDPTLADPGVVDAVLSNYLVTRNQGEEAQGEVTIIVSTPNTVTIGNGQVFTANGNTYTANSAFTAKVEASQINSATDRLLTELADGTYAFTIDVTCTVPGTAGIITQNTLVIPASLPLNYITSYATSDFTGGLDQETNNQLLTKLQQGISAKAPSNRINMQAMLLADPNFANVVASSIVGFGDLDMLRDQHTIWPGSLGGKADWYIRTVELVVQLALTKTCTLISLNGDGSGNWQFSIARDDAPGFYEIVSVVPPTASNTLGSLPNIADTRGLDLTGPGFVPDIETVAEGAYTRYQTSVVTFQDTFTVGQDALDIGATASYNVTVSCLPQIDAINDYMVSYPVRSYGADILVKAPVPCFLQIYFRIAKNRTQTSPNIPAIQTAVAHAVNTVDFTGRLYAAALQDVIAGYLTEGMSVGSIDMFGRIRQPDGTMTYLRSNEVLVVPSLPGTMVSPQSVQFFVNPTNINIEISTEIPLPV